MFDSSSKQSVNAVDQLLKLIKPLTYLFWCFGVNIQMNFNSNGIVVDKMTNRPPKHPYSYLQLSYNVICLILMVVGSATGFVHLAYQIANEKFENFITQILKIFTFLNNAVVYIVLLRNQEKFSALASKIIYEIGNFIHTNPESSKYVKYIKRMICLYYTYLIFLIFWKLLHVIYIFAWDSPAFQQCNNIAANFYNNSKICPYLAFLLIIYFNICVFVFLLSVASMVLMSILLILINANFDILKSQTHHITCHNVQDSQLGLFIRHHREVCDRLLEISKSFCYQIFVWYSFEIFDITLLFRVVTDYQLSTFTRFTYSVLLSAVLTSFLIKTILISSLNCKVIDALDVVHIDDGLDFCAYVPKYQRQAFEKTKYYFHIYCSRVTMNPPCISGWGFFKINKQFLLTVGGIVLSYSVIIHSFTR